MYYIYILYSESSDLFYVGSSEDPWERYNYHNTQDKTTFTSKHRPWLLKAVFEAGTTRGQAFIIEQWIKKQKSKKLLFKLIDPAHLPDRALAHLVRVPDVRD